MYEYIHHLWVSHPHLSPLPPYMTMLICTAHLSMFFPNTEHYLSTNNSAGWPLAWSTLLSSSFSDIPWVSSRAAGFQICFIRLTWEIYQIYTKVHSKYIYLTWQEIVLTNLCILTDCTLFFNSWHITDQLIWCWRSSKSWFIFIFCKIDTKRNLINCLLYCQHLIDQMPRLQSPIGQLSLKQSERLYKR